MNKYGYKVYYKNKHKLILFRVTNSFDLAKYEVLWQIQHSKDNNILCWLIVPIKTKHGYKKLWKGCPF